MEKRQPVDSEAELLKEAHLLDPGNLQEIVAFLTGMLVQGILPNMIWDSIKGTVGAIRQRFGAARIEELEALVVREMQKIQRKGKHLSEEDLHLRAQELLQKIRQA